MRQLLLFLAISSTMLFGQSPENSPSPYSRPLTEIERRVVYAQLLNYKAAIVEIQGLKDLVVRQEAQAKIEKEIWDKSIEIAKKETELAQKERDLAFKERDLDKEQATFYKEAYTVAAHKPGGVGCFFKRLFTIGVARCH